VRVTGLCLTCNGTGAQGEWHVWPDGRRIHLLVDCESCKGEGTAEYDDSMEDWDFCDVTSSETQRPTSTGDDALFSGEGEV
jgi:DnaJ-class molecular chaperone